MVSKKTVTVENAKFVPKLDVSQENKPKVKKVKNKGVNISIYELKHVGAEPIWDYDKAIDFDTETFEKQLRQCIWFYNYFYTSKDLKKQVDAWVQNNMPTLSKQELSYYIMSEPEWTPMTVCSLIRAHAQGMPMREKYKLYIVGKIKDVISRTAKLPDVIEKVEKKVYVPTIQDRLNEKTASIIGEIEGQVDNVFRGKPATDIYQLITDKNLAQLQVCKVKAKFQKQITELADYLEASKSKEKTDEEEQLTEAYGHLTNIDVKRINSFYIKLMSDLDSYATIKKQAKATKRAIKKPKSLNKEKVTAKVKYLKESKELKMFSITPTAILGSSVCWVYNIKSRKIGKYVADSHTVLGIKGTSITGFSETGSVQKTLRKPEIQLLAFMKASKVELRTYLKEIKSVDIKLNGRLSEDILILKVE